MTDNRTNEPTPEQVEAAAKAMHETGNPWFAAYGDWGAAGFEIKKAFRESARAALDAADAHLPTVEQIAEAILSADTAIHDSPNPEEQALGAARAVRALFGEVEGEAPKTHEHIYEPCTCDQAECQRQVCVWCEHVTGEVAGDE